MQKIFTILLLSVLLGTQVQAQVNRCATSEHEAILRAKDPNYDAKRAQLESFTAKAIEKRQTEANYKSEATDLVVTIPVVFHVVYKTAAQNISDTYLLQQLDILNKDFRRLNEDTTDTPEDFAAVAGDAGIEFCLASIDPNGNPTTGIIRYETDVNSWSTNDDIKFAAEGGADAWPADSYLNFWVGNLGAFLLGYAQFPGGPDVTDGVVIHYEHVGYNDAGYPYHLGRTATHEVGHWLNLRHIWGDDTNCAGSDLVADTPNQKVENYGCPGFPETDACSATFPGIMFQNYMDYSDDACMNLFTQGQAERMWALFEPGGDRYGLTASEGCGLQPHDAQAIMSLPGGTVCDLTVTPQVTIKNHGSEVLTSLDITYSIDGGTPLTYDWTGSLASAASTVVTLPAVTVTEDEHTLEVTVDNPNGFIDADLSDNTVESEFVVNMGTMALPLAQGFETSGFPYTGYTLYNPDGEEEWERTNLAAATGTYSIYINHFSNSNIGEADEFVLPAYNFTGLPEVEFTFDVAYALYTADGTYSDTLEVLVSNDCGASWDLMYKKANPDLQTAPVHTISFKPTDEEWRNESIDLSSYIGSEQVFVKFRTITNYENNLYIDNININDGTIQSISGMAHDFAINLYPNPSDDMVQVRYNMPIGGEGTISITDLVGKVVYSEQINVIGGVNNLTINTAELAPGYYQVQISTNGLKSGESLIIE
jgi:hypothetical protein